MPVVAGAGYTGAGPSGVGVAATVDVGVFSLVTRLAAKISWLITPVRGPEVRMISSDPSTAATVPVTKPWATTWSKRLWLATLWAAARAPDAVPSALASAQMLIK